MLIDPKTADIYAIKRCAPLVCGINEVQSEGFASSDPYALAGLVDKLYFPEDEVLCHLSSGNKNLLNFYNLEGDKTDKYQSKKQDLSVSVSEKGDYDHFMHKEIHEQPELIRSLTHYYFAGEGVPALEKAIEKKPENIHMVACGTAFYAGLVIKDHVEKLNRIRCHAELGSEFRYKNPVLESNDLGLFISQSGETADTLAAQSLCKTNGLSTMSIVNVEGSTLFRDCEDNLLIRAGIEVGVASTKAFTQQVLTGMVFSAALNGILSNAEKKKDMAAKFSLLAERVDKVLAKKKL